MDYNNAYRRNGWQPPTDMSFETQDTVSGQTYPQANLQANPNRPPTSTTPERNLSTAATMEALGIRIRPPGLHPPATSYYRPPRAMHEQIYRPPNPAHPAHPAHHPRPVSWTGYGADVPQYYSLSSYQGGGNGFMYYPPIDRSGNHLKIPDETIDFANLESEWRVFQNGLSHVGDHQPVPTSRKYHPESNSDLLSFDFNFATSNPTSSASLSSSAQVPTEETELPAYTETISYPSSEYTPRSSLTLSSTALSPVPSPRCPPPDLPKVGSRLKASPSPRLSKRAAPYTLDGARKRWSTGSYTSSPSQRSSPSMHPSAETYQPPSKTCRYSVPSAASLLPSNFPNTPVLGSSPARFYQHSFLLPSNSDAGSGTLSSSINTFPQGTFRTLQSSVDPGGRCFDPYANLSDPPDLLGPLREEQSAPPAKDLDPEDTELVPHEQELRFENDLYTPRWVRGHGNKREGWCGICKPGRWLVLKNSAFWYDKSFTHGVSAATGRAFEPPKDTRRMEGNADIWEGLCGSCNDWIPLVSSKKKGTTWFRHAYKCQSQSKARDTAKRRREANLSAAPTGRPSTACSSNKSPVPTLSTSIAPTSSTTTELLHPPLPNSGTLGDRTHAGMKTRSNLQTFSSMI